LLNQTILSQIPASVPLPDEQRAIAHILGTLDDKIELNRRMNETLEALARAIFKSWFVDFDPVRAKAEGREPTGMDAATAALFPDSFQESPLGKIPKGWGVRRLGEVTGVNKRTISAGYPHRTIEYIEISSVVTGKLSGSTKYELNEAPSRAKRLVAHGDTIWSCVRPNRKSYLFIYNPTPNLVVSTGFAVLTPKQVSRTYLFEWVTTEDFVEYLSYNADGSAYPAVRPERFSEAEILLPPLALLDRFEQVAGPMRDKIAHNDRESRTLAAIRDALLPKLISGEIRVKV
jgi:type I restriction enzyme S subunit